MFIQDFSSPQLGGLILSSMSHHPTSSPFNVNDIREAKPQVDPIDPTVSGPSHSQVQIDTLLGMKREVTGLIHSSIPCLNLLISPHLPRPWIKGA